MLDHPTADQIKAKLLAPTLAGHKNLTLSEQNFECISEILYDTAEKTGGFQNWTLAWLQFCEAANRDPLEKVGMILAYADIDRHCGNRLGAHEKDMEMQAFVVLQKQKSEGDSVVRKA